MRNLPPKRQRWARVRVAFLGTLLLGGGAAVTRRAYELQVERAPALREMAEAQYLRDIRLAPKRGTVYDRHGAALAVSVEVDSVYANPRELQRLGANPSRLAAQIASIVRIDEDRIRTRLESDRLFVWIKRRITPQLAARIRELELPGIYMVQEARRFYPNRSLASHVLGFANIDGVGIEGLELELEEQLRGSVREVPAIRDRRGAVVFSEQLLDDRAARGDDVTLTIDKTIQHLAERELALAVQTFEAQAGSVVVMDPRNGELLAVANYPTYDPNQPGRSAMAARRNRAVTDRFEPGSTVKPFTIAAALARRTIRSEQLIDCESGRMQIGEEDWISDTSPHGDLTPAQILAFSSNIGTHKIGDSLGRRGLYRAFRRFGFGQETGLPLPGEAAGSLRHYDEWYALDAATISFGQGMSATSVQLATAMSAIANGGRLMEPILVRRVTDGTGAVVMETLPRVRRQVIPQRTARLVADMLTAVTGPGGTGTEAAIDGYLVAGKTGTAQKADHVRGGYADDEWLASFVGFVPAENPRLVISVVIDEPLIAHYGGSVAGPVFRRIGEASLRHLGVPPSGGGEALAEYVAERARLARAAEADQESAVVAAPSESEETVAVAQREPGAGQARVPDLTGRAARACLVTLAEASLSAALEGSGIVVAQDPSPGDIVPAGTAVRLLLSRPNVGDRAPEPPQVAQVSP